MTTDKNKHKQVDLTSERRPPLPTARRTLRTTTWGFWYKLPTSASRQVAQLAQPSEELARMEQNSMALPCPTAEATTLPPNTKDI